MAQSEGSSRLSWIVRAIVSALAVTAFVLGVIGFRIYLPGHDDYGDGWLDVSYNSLQLFVLGADPLQEAKNLPVVLQIARFLAPAVTAYLIAVTATSVLGRRYVQMRIRLARRHTIVTGPPDIARRLADQVLAENTSLSGVVVVGTGRLPGGHGVLPLAGDPRDPRVLRKAGARRAREVIAVGPDTATNAEIGIAVHQISRDTRRPIPCFAEARDTELFEAVIEDKIRPGEVHRIESFSRAQRTARWLLNSIPPAPEGGGRPTVLVVGYEPLGRAVTERLISGWSDGAATPEQTFNLRVLAPDVPAEVVRRRHSRPGSPITLTARRFDPAWLTSASDLLVPTAGGESVRPDFIYVCMEDDVSGISAGKAAAELLSHHPVKVAVAVADSPVVGVSADQLNGAEAGGRQVGAAQLMLFNVLRTVYNIASLRTGLNEELARAIHAAYQSGTGGSTPSPNSMKDWKEADETFKEANREQAWDIAPKLARIGLTAVPAERVNGPAAKMSDAEVEVLARMEHERWMRERLLQGWRFGAERSDRLRHHPDLVPWPRLAPESKDSDRAAVRVIPQLLAQVGLQLVRGEGNGWPPAGDQR